MKLVLSIIFDSEHLVNKMNLKREIEDANQTKNLELSATQAKLKMIVHASKYSPRQPFRRPLTTENHIIN